MNIAEILKNAPKGTKLYSPLFGDVALQEVINELEHPIRVAICSTGKLDSFTEEGKYNNNYPDGECILFPSKENRDWNTFIVIKPGDVVASNSLLCLMKDSNTIIFTYDINAKAFSSAINNMTITNYRKATDRETTLMFNTIARAGFKYNPANASIERVNYNQFKSFDRVLVRDREADYWVCDHFSHMRKKNYICSGDIAWRYCIPYNDETKHLVGTNKTI